MSTTWLITGSSRGLGLEFIRQLSADKDNTVFATCRNPSKAAPLEALSKDPNTKATLHIIALDTDDQSSILQAAKEVSSILGDERGIDYFLSNAAIGGDKDTGLTIDPEDFIVKIKANVLGPALVAQAFVPLVERSNRKVYLNMSSGLGSIGLDLGPKGASYSISKAALNMLTYKLKAAKPEVIFISMDPGWVKTDMGGPGALLEQDFSISSMLKVLKSLTAKDSGSFFNYSGTIVPW